MVAVYDGRLAVGCEVAEDVTAEPESVVAVHCQGVEDGVVVDVGGWVGGVDGDLVAAEHVDVVEGADVDLAGNVVEGEAALALEGEAVFAEALAVVCADAEVLSAEPHLAVVLGQSENLVVGQAVGAVEEATVAAVDVVDDESSVGGEVELAVAGDDLGHPVGAQVVLPAADFGTTETAECQHEENCCQNACSLHEMET